MNGSNNYFIGGGILAVLFLILLLFSWSSVPAGHVGVVTSFGEVMEEPLDPGFHWVAFWKRVNLLSTQTQEDKEEADVPTKEGLTIRLEASLLYSLKRDKAVELFKSVGTKYKDVVVTPQFRSALRGATVKHSAKDLYTAGRAEIENELEKTVKAMLEERGILCEKVLLRNLALPKTVKEAIESKLAAEQDAQRMEFVIEKATKEAEKQRVEAQGIADSQKIIDGTLTDSYLRYLWIKALDTAAKEPSTQIYIPIGNDGLPLFKEIGAKKNGP